MTKLQFSFVSFELFSPNLDFPIPSQSLAHIYSGFNCRCYKVELKVHVIQTNSAHTIQMLLCVCCTCGLISAKIITGRNDKFLTLRNACKDVEMWPIFAESLKNTF